MSFAIQTTFVLRNPFSGSIAVANPFQAASVTVGLEDHRADADATAAVAAVADKTVAFDIDVINIVKAVGMLVALL